jgi:hypothetical protein
MEQQNSSENPKVINQVDVTKHDRFNGFKAFLKKRPPKKRLAIVSGASIGVLLMGAIGAFTLIKDNSEPLPEPVVESTYVAPAEKIYSPLTGLETTAELAARPVTGVMIENSIDARPQSGLQEAGVVFEAIAEGGITRFLALFQEAQPENIGPIRSARPYYVQWVSGFDAAYVHSGGSGEALALIRALGVKDLDHGAFGERIASRVSNRYAPHNVYTSMARIDEIRTAQGFTSSDFTPFARIPEEEKTVESTPEAAEPAIVPITASSISFNISSFLYNTSYTYNAEAKNYQRIMGNQPHTDERSGKQISPSVVVALIASYGIHPDGIHSSYGSIGTGKAIIFQNGQVIEATWQKPEQTSPLTFKDAAGEDFAFERGQMWITAIPDGRVSYTP